jgi:excinuclease ABC subunit C
MAAPSHFDLDLFLSHLTHHPGVYRMYSVKDEVIYVGKAKNLKKASGELFSQSP